MRAQPSFQYYSPPCATFVSKFCMFLVYYQTQHNRLDKLREAPLVQLRGGPYFVLR